MKISDTLVSIYSRRDDQIISIKAAMSDGFSFIERRLKLHYILSLTSIVSPYKQEIIGRHFLNINKFTNAEFNKYLYILVKIRNLSAHFNLSGQIYLNDSEPFMKVVCRESNAMFPMFVDNRLTLYGALVLMSWMMDKKHIHTLVNNLLSNWDLSFYGATLDGVEKTKRELISNLCENSNTNTDIIKTDYPKRVYIVNREEYDVVNYRVRKNLFYIFFAFERCLSKDLEQTRYTFSKSVYDMIAEHPIIKVKSKYIDQLTFLRNAWLHGNWLRDRIIFDDKETKLTIGFISKILLKWKNIIRSQGIHKKFKPFLDAIEDFVNDIFILKFEDIVKLSFKIFDKALFDAEKLSSRVSKTKRAAERITKDSIINKYDWDDLIRLNEGRISFDLRKVVFKDGKQRFFDYHKVDLYHYRSTKNIFINGVDTKNKEIYFLDFTGVVKQEPKINDIKINKFKVTKEIAITNQIKLINIRKP